MGKQPSLRDFPITQQSIQHHRSFLDNEIPEGHVWLEQSKLEPTPPPFPLTISSPSPVCFQLFLGSIFGCLLVCNIIITASLSSRASNHNKQRVIPSIRFRNSSFSLAFRSSSVSKTAFNT